MDWWTGFYMITASVMKELNEIMKWKLFCVTLNVLPAGNYMFKVNINSLLALNKFHTCVSVVNFEPVDAGWARNEENKL